MTRSRACAFASVCALSLLTGCGGAIRPDELERGVSSLASDAATGELLAEQRLRDRVTETFTRAQARALGERVTHEAEKLHDADAGPATRAAKEAAAGLAEDISDALSELQVAPGNRQVAGHVERLLRDAAADARRLQARL